MNKILWRSSALSLLAALLCFSGCASLAKIDPFSAPAPKKISVPEKNVPAAGAADTRPLFVIERNKNANIIHYDASLTSDGELNPKEPVIAYWILLAEDGRRKKLNWLEKKKAYGVRIQPDPSTKGYILTLAAAPWVPLTVRKIGETVRAEGVINGRRAVLQKMFIQARDRLLGPKVEYVELYGKDIETGEDRREKIIPK